MDKVAYAEQLKKLSDRLVEIQRPIRILDAIKWPPGTEARYLAAGGKQLPEINVDTYQHTELAFSLNTKRDELKFLHDDIKRQLGEQDRLGRILSDTTEQFLIVMDLLEARGKPEFLTYSQKLYGSARDHLRGDKKTLIELGEQLCRVFSLPAAKKLATKHERNIDAPQAVIYLKERLRSYFPEGEVNVILSDGIVSDAAAGGDSIKLNSTRQFSQRDLHVLEVHEGWVHVATTLNGRRQPYATWLSMGSPRITAIQEGLAVLLETLTFSSFPGRARRISDRVMAIDMAERGANFNEVYQYFLARDLTEHDSYVIAQRVFRGGQVEGGSCFTKDISYTKGLIETVNFIRSAITSGVPEILSTLFVGKVTLDDVPVLYEYTLEGLIQEPTYMPEIFRDLCGLYTWFGFSSGLALVDLDSVQAHFEELFAQLPERQAVIAPTEDTEL